jgi:hypothetical protein
MPKRIEIALVAKKTPACPGACVRGVRLTPELRPSVTAKPQQCHSFQILFAIALGASVGIAVSYAEPWMAAITTGIGGFVTTLAVQAGLWLRKMIAGDDRRIV